jgi:hypothetical protein
MKKEIYLSWGSSKPVWYFNVSVQRGLFLRVQRAAYTADAATKEGQNVTVLYSINASSAKQNTICSIYIHRNRVKHHTTPDPVIRGFRR